MLLALFGASSPATVSGQPFGEFPVPTADSYLQGIAAGPDGALWFTEKNGNKIGRITTAGLVTEFTVPTAGSLPDGIAAGPDGALWFTEQIGNKIGRITTAGVITEFTVPTPGSWPLGIAAGPDSALWFTEYRGNKIGRITTAGVITEFTVPTFNTSPIGIAAGPDGALWFTEYTGNKGIGRITTAGVVTEFKVPLPSGFSNSLPDGIAAGPDGALWFTEELLGNKIGRITTAGVITEFTLAAIGLPVGIAAGPDGALWFTDNLRNKIGRITTAGVITEFTVPTANSGVSRIAAGPDGALWFTESVSNKIGRITAPCAQGPNALCLNNGRFRAQTQFTTPQVQSETGQAFAETASGVGQAVALTSDTGYFWFFSSNNVEMVVKVVDGRTFNSRFWVFAGGLTNVNVVLTVTDTQTGTVKTYTNPQGVAFQPIQDTDAFAGAGAIEASTNAPDGSAGAAALAISPELSDLLEAAAPTSQAASPKAMSAETACAADATTLCLNGGRFRVQTQWTTPQGQSGAGQAVPLTSDTGYFWFFSSNNVEMVVKAVTGCTFNARYWVFAGGLTNVNVIMTVTDTQTGVVKTYTNPQGAPFQPIQDTSAFATCP